MTVRTTSRYLAPLFLLLSVCPQPTQLTGSDYLQRYITHRTTRVESCYSCLLQNGGSRAVLTAREVAQKLYTDTPKDRLWMARNNCEQNLIALVKHGRAACYRYNETGALEEYKEVTEGYHFNMDESLVWGLRVKISKL